MGRKGAPAIDAILVLLDDRDEGVRMAACWAIAEIGVDNPGVQEGLATVEADHVDVVRRLARWARRKIAAQGIYAPIEVKAREATHPVSVVSCPSGG
jgi:HEAT repeat protein